MRRNSRTNRRGTLLLMVVGLLASLFMIISAFLTLARSDNRRLQSTQRADQTDAILRSADNVILSAIRQSWADGDGNLLAGGWTKPNPKITEPLTEALVPEFSPVDIPGSGGTAWLSGPEVVRNRAAGLDGMGLVVDGSVGDLRLHWRVTSSFGRAAARRHLPLIGWGELDSGSLSIYALKQPGLMLAGNSDGLWDAGDFTRNARRPFMDADGDGVPDSFFPAMGTLTEMANAIAGTPVRTPPEKIEDLTGTEYFNPSDVPSPSESGLRAVLREMWQRFDDRAKYELAVKIESTGGKVSLASPGEYRIGTDGSVWNRAFVMQMFNWVRHQNDTNWLSLGAPGDHVKIAALTSAAPQVEPYLRYRGGLLATWQELESIRSPLAQTSVPRALKDFESAFQHTLIPERTTRFNLAEQATGALGAIWPKMASIDAAWFNEAYQGSGYLPFARAEYSRRQLLTTISNSDDLARDLDPKRPDWDTGDPAHVHYSDDCDMGIYGGALKFFLGDIARAFDQNGNYKPDDTVHGHSVVRQLANYYYEMLAPCTNWGALVDIDKTPTSTDEQASSRREQAFMLAVNTVAFAAPRTNGFIDTVWYKDVNPATSLERTYIGYAPQLFISEVVAYCSGGDTASPTAPPKYGVGIELFNPNEPSPDVTDDPTDKTLKFQYGDSVDPFALNLDQFRISVSDGSSASPDVPQPITAGLPGRRLTGRNFMTVAMGDVTKFADCEVQVPVAVAPENDQIIVKLWRVDSENRPWLIDRLVVGEDPDHEIPPPTPSGREYEWVIDTARDCRETPHFRRWATPDDLSRYDVPARWHLVTNLHHDKHAKSDRGDPDDPDDVEEPPVPIESYTANLGHPWPSIPSGELDKAAAPSVPLYTMNAGSPASGAAWWRQNLPNPEERLPGWFFAEVHGAYRPVSFPTVGFMHFIPRFSHSIGATEAVMADVLRRQWQICDRPGSGSGGISGGSSGGSSTPSGSSAAGPSAGPAAGPSGGTGSSSGGASGTGISWSASDGIYPADFGHMPIFDNQTFTISTGSYFDDANAGRIPWGLLVYDYFTTLDPKADYDNDADHRPDVDPRRIPGRIDINNAPWYVLAGLPVINPLPDLTGVATDIDVVTASPAFWSEKSGVLVGDITAVDNPFLATAAGGTFWRFQRPAGVPSIPNQTLIVDQGWIRLGPFLAQAIASYRDQGRYAPNPDFTSAPNPFWYADRRNNGTDTDGSGRANMQYRLESGTHWNLGGFQYGPIRRGDGTPANPLKYGFLSLGELANVKGFDSPVYGASATGDAAQLVYNPLGRAGMQPSQVKEPDFFKAVSLLALLDTHFLTTRSNTFTVYMTLMNRDPDQQQSSVRVQYTVDRSNLLPELAVDPATGAPLMQPTPSAGRAPIIIQHAGLPQIITRREVGYYDMQYDQ